jgi:hypothetical protein
MCIRYTYDEDSGQREVRNAISWYYEERKEKCEFWVTNHDYVEKGLIQRTRASCTILHKTLYDIKNLQDFHSGKMIIT